jgi:hypothetical protein
MFSLLLAYVTDEVSLKILKVSCFFISSLFDVTLLRDDVP